MYSRTQRIKSLSNSPDAFYSEIFASTSTYVNSIWGFMGLIRYTPSHIKTERKFHMHFGEALVSLLEKTVSKKIKYYSRTKLHNDKYINLINYCNNYIDRAAQNKIIDILLKYNRNFNTYARKKIPKIVVNNLESNDVRGIELLRNFYRIIGTEDFNTLMSITKDGSKNPAFNEILSKTKLFDYLKYDEETVNNSYKEKVKLIKAVARTPTLIKRLPFNLHVDLRHLKEIAPGMRFKLMRFAFKHETDQASRCWYYGDNLVNQINFRKQRAKENKLIISEISVEEMKELLFAVCLKKNDEFTYWIKNYAVHLACINSVIRVNRKDVTI